MCKQIGLLLLLIFTLYACSFSQQPPVIQLNQIGFYPNSPKIAIVTGDVSSDEFQVKSVDAEKIIFKGRLGSPRKSAYSNTTTRVADFSGLNSEGKFIIEVPGVEKSYPFTISNSFLKSTAVGVLKGYYFQRVSMPLDEKYAGKWHRTGFHPDNVVYVHPSAATANRPAGTAISSPYGWYDAGDYNKYIVNSGITMGTLLSAYEDFPDYFKSLNTNIPESGDAVPDILNEIIYNLRWMLTMQDPFDGGVYHKCTNAVFDGMVMPGVTKAPRYVVQKSTAATLDFAAVTAQSARILKKFEKQYPRLSDSCIAAAKNAWRWAQENPALLYEQNEMNKKFQPAVTTGAYGDRSVTDEWLWAAAELFCTTKEIQYLDSLNAQLKKPVHLPSWGNVAMLGYYSLIRIQSSLPNSVKIAALRDSVIDMADEYLIKASQNAFATVMGQSARDYNWGGNSNAANQGILLIRAYLLTENKKYLDAAISNLDYILGRNATGYSFITGFGGKTPMHPHHRQSEADGVEDPVPGLLVGGPNIGRQDNCKYPFTEIETAYTDVMCSYASNEIAINWNAPIVYLANALEALKVKAGYVGRN
ncbi:MAG TPA: glycoside hydrolase family 9 protein [Chitinophagaceae bacterium]|nr:glycoside hydrolase family 9 protein [Chitinophagaceae bacterium]